MAAAQAKEAEAQMNAQHPAPGPFPVQTNTSLQGQMPLGYSQPPQAVQQQQQQPELQSHAPFGYAQAPMAGYPQGQMGFTPLQQPVPGAPIQVASQSSMVYTGPPSYQHTMAAPQIQQLTMIKQPISVGFGAPVIQPGVQMMQMQYTLVQQQQQQPQQQQQQQMAPPKAESPPPYPGTPANVKFKMPGAPKDKDLYK